MIPASYYGALAEANDYFANRLHESAWSGADVVDRPKALRAATAIIDTLNFKGDKHTLWTLKQDTPSPSTESIQSANAEQELEFPRGRDIEIPQDIRIACYEIAHALLDGKDPDLELENLGVISQGYASVRTTFSRDHVPLEHIVNGVPAPTAWRLLRPYLVDNDAIRLLRVS